jgi:DNA helicase HerA-like ATPase
MGLNETQEGVLNIAFRYADENGLLLIDMDDLQAVLVACAENAGELATKYGNVTKASVGAIQRQLLAFESQGADRFFGEPAFEIHDFIRTDDKGRGLVNILAAEKLMQSPKLYATFLLWLLSELFEALPEVGDPEKPVLVFFFDEAHLLFDDAPEALFDKVEQVVRLIRSKGVGVYFVTQNPIDIPEKIAGQLGNRVQHALRAFTPRDQKAIKAAAQTFRINPDLDVEKAITELKVGEALVSTLDDDGAPGVVQRTLIAPPRSRLGPVSAPERAAIQASSPVEGKYDTAVNRDPPPKCWPRRPPMPPPPRSRCRNRARRHSARRHASRLAVGQGRQGGDRCGGFVRRRGNRGADQRQENPRLARRIRSQRGGRLGRHQPGRRRVRPLRARPAGRFAALIAPA